MIRVGRSAWLRTKEGEEGISSALDEISEGDGEGAIMEEEMEEEDILHFIQRNATWNVTWRDLTEEMKKQEEN